MLRFRYYITLSCSNRLARHSGLVPESISFKSKHWIPEPVRYDMVFLETYNYKPSHCRNGFAGSDKTILTVRAILTTTNSGLIRAVPRRMTRCAPTVAAIIWPAAITSPILHITCPPIIKNNSAARFEVMFSTLLWAVAFLMLNPSNETKARAKKAPVPGPKKPS